MTGTKEFALNYRRNTRQLLWNLKNLNKEIERCENILKEYELRSQCRKMFDAAEKVFNMYDAALLQEIDKTEPESIKEKREKAAELYEVCFLSLTNKQLADSVIFSKRFYELFDVLLETPPKASESTRTDQG